MRLSTQGVYAVHKVTVAPATPAFAPISTSADVYIGGLTNRFDFVAFNQLRLDRFARSVLVHTQNLSDAATTTQESPAVGYTNPTLSNPIEPNPIQSNPTWSASLWGKVLPEDTQHMHNNNVVSTYLLVHHATSKIDFCAEQDARWLLRNDVETRRCPSAGHVSPCNPMWESVARKTRLGQTQHDHCMDKGITESSMDQPVWRQPPSFRESRVCASFVPTPSTSILAE